RAAKQSFEPVVDDRGTALHVEQGIVDRPTDLTGKQAERVDLAAVGEAVDQAHIRTAEVSPVALRFETEHPGLGLPAIADLATGGAAIRVVRAFGTESRVSPAVVAGAPTAVD